MIGRLASVGLPLLSELLPSVAVKRFVSLGGANKLIAIPVEFLSYSRVGTSV